MLAGLGEGAARAEEGDRVGNGSGALDVALAGARGGIGRDTGQRRVVYAKDMNGHSFVVPVSTLRSMLDDDTAFTPLTTCTS